MKRTSKMNCNHKVLPKLNAWRGERMGSWYLPIHTYWPFIVQTYPLRSKLVSWFVTLKFTFQIHNVVLIVKNMATTKDSARTKQNVDRLEKEIIKVKYQKNIPFHEARQQVEGPVIDPSKNSCATVSKSHQWTSNIKAPNTFKTEEEWLTHTIDSLLKRLDAIKAQKSMQNKPSTSSASQLCEITLPAHASEHTNESRKLNSASAMPSSVQHDTSAAQSDENEMELNITTSKRAIHEVSSEEEPTSPLPSKRTAPGPLASGQDGTFVPKGAGRGGPSKISTFCRNPPRSGGQGSSGRDRSPIRLPEGTKPSVPPKPGNQSKSKNDKNSPY